MEAWGPDWARDVVWYQIFPERFRNGDSTNDPTLADIKGSWPHDYTSDWQVHPWESDWYEFQPWEQVNGKDIWFNIQRRRYGGDLQGILERLDYLEDLGIGAIYLNPVFDSPSLHKYDATTYHHIDPNFGPDPAGDREIIAAEVPHDPATWVWTSADSLALHLIDEIHRRGMKVIFDGVFNHLGINSWVFRDVMEKQQESLYAEWFTVSAWDDPNTEANEFDYEGWFGVRELPELREDENGIVAGPREYIFAATSRWMDPNGDGNPADGIDGWRLDVAFNVHHNFWKAWRKHVKSINSQSYLTAEVVEPIKALRPYLQGDEFDAVMNYNFAFACSEYIFAGANRTSTSEFDHRLRTLREAFHPGVAYIMQNLYDSHDTNRLGSHIVNREKSHYREWGEYFNFSRGSNPDYNTGKPSREDYRLQQLAALFQMTYPGAPMIYYGDEVGMWGANDPCSRKPMVWADKSYADEACQPDGSRKDIGAAVAVDGDLLDYYKRLIHLRKELPPLRWGDYRTLLVDDGNRVYAFAREYDGQKVVVVLNNSAAEQSVELPISGSWVDAWNDNEVVPTDGESVIISVQPLGGRILLHDR